MRPTPGWPRAVPVEPIEDQRQEEQPIDLRRRQDIAAVGDAEHRDSRQNGLLVLASGLFSSRSWTAP